MKSHGMPGEFFFKALYKGTLSVAYFRSFLEAQAVFDETVIWPVEVYDNGTVYCPSEEELNDAF